MENVKEQETATDVKESIAENKTVTENKTALDLNELKTFLETTVDKAVQNAGIDRVDIKQVKLPNVSEDASGLGERDLANKKMRKFINQAKSKGFNAEGATSSGTTLSVPTEFSGELAKLLYAEGVIRKNAKIIPMTSMKLTLNVLDGQAEASWVGQGNAKDGTNDTFRDVTFERHTLAFIKPVSNELIQDAGFDIVGELLEISKDAFLAKEDSAGFIGTGSPITGVTKVTGTNEVTLTNRLSNSLSYQKVLDMVYASPVRKSGNEKFYMHRSVWSKVRGLEDGNGNLIGAGQNLTNPNFEGIPVVLVEDMTPASNDSTGMTYCVYGDMKNAGMAVRDEFNVTASEHATVEGVSMFETNQTAFRFEEAVDIQVIHPSGFSVLRSVH